MIKPIHLFIATIFFAITGNAQSAKKGAIALYYPERSNWGTKAPEALGIAAMEIMWCMLTPLTIW